MNCGGNPAEAFGPGMVDDMLLNRTDARVTFSMCNMGVRNRDLSSKGLGLLT
jgi:hypothetical protein